MEQNGYQLNTNARNILCLRNIGKTYVSDSGKQVQVLKDINLDIRHGELVTLVGATGSGKTTLLNMIAGLLAADTGSITPDATLDMKTELAYVFQHYTLLPWLTVLKNVAFGLLLRKVPGRQRTEQALKLIEKVGLGGFEKAYPHELSGGMRQRAAIAQALAIQPRLLLMDEPFGSLDDTMRTQLQQMLITLHQQAQTTTLFVTHNIDEAIILADRIIVLSKSPGCVLNEITGLPKKIKNRTDRQFTDLFVRIRNLIA